MGWAELYAVAREQHGVFATRNAPSVGLTSAAVRARAARDGLLRPYAGTIVVPGTTVDHRTWLAAAQLHLGPEAAAADVSGAWLHGLAQRPPTFPQLLLPHARRTSAPRLAVHRSRFVTDEDRMRVDGISVLRLPFLLLAMAPRAGVDALLGFAIDGLQRNLFQTAELADRLGAVGAMPGRQRVELVLAHLLRDRSDSRFESLVRDALRAAGLRPTTGPHRVIAPDGRAVHLDIAFPAHRVAVECQGFGAHRSRAQLERDTLRDNTIALLDDWIVLRLTWTMWRSAWDAFLARLVALLAGRGPA